MIKLFLFFAKFVFFHKMNCIFCSQNTICTKCQTTVAIRDIGQNYCPKLGYCFGKRIVISPICFATILAFHEYSLTKGVKHHPGFINKGHSKSLHPYYLNDDVFHGSIIRWNFVSQTSSLKFLLDSLNCAYTFPCEFSNITDGIALIQKIDYLFRFFPLFILGLGGTCRSAEFTSFLNILLFPRFRIKGLCYYKFISPKLIC